jgi:hypothetical protein
LVARKPRMNTVAMVSAMPPAKLQDIQHENTGQNTAQHTQEVSGETGQLTARKPRINTVAMVSAMPPAKLQHRTWHAGQDIQSSWPGPHPRREDSICCIVFVLFVPAVLYGIAAEHNTHTRGQRGTEGSWLPGSPE